MLLAYPRRYRSVDDDGAPVDYTFADSVAEGERRRQSEPIHRRKDDDEAVSIAYPRQRNNAFTQARTFAPQAPDTLQTAQARESAARGAVCQATPDAAVPSPQELPAGRSIRRTAQYAGQGSAPRNETLQAGAQPDNRQAASPAPVREGVPAINGAQYAAPPTQEMPDWLRAAQQNQTLYHDNRRSPHVAAAQRPLNAAEYAASGYPPELVAGQQTEEAEAGFAQGAGHRSHGAQAALPNLRRVYEGVPGGYRRPAPARDAVPSAADPSPYPGDEATQNAPYTVTQEPRRRARRGEPEDGEPENTEPEDEEEAEKRKPKIPILGIVVFAVAILMVGLWIAQITFGNLKTGVLSAKAEAIQKLADTHTFEYRDLVEREAAANNLNPAFIAAIIYNESSFNPKAESNVGARGLMQMMQDTAEWVHGKIDASTDYSFDLMYDPDTNVKYACWYLAYLGKRFHNDPVLVAAAFHAGQTTVQNWLNDSRYSTDSQTIELKNMAEGPTKNYATRVMNSYAIYRRLYYEGGLPAAAANAA